MDTKEDQRETTIVQKAGESAAADKKESSQTGAWNGKRLAPFLTVLLGSIMIAMTLFVPFATATSDHREYLEKNPDAMAFEEAGMTNEDATDVSLFEFGRMYYAAADMGVSKTMSIVCLVAISAFALLALLTLLFSILRKPVAVLAFDILAFGAFNVLRWDFEDRGVIPTSNYDWGMAQYLFSVGAIIVAAGAIALLVMKIKAKKQGKAMSEDMLKAEEMHAVSAVVE